MQTSIFFINPNQQKNIIYQNLSRVALKETLVRLISNNYFHINKGKLIPKNYFRVLVSFESSYSSEDESLNFKKNELHELNDINIYILKMAIFLWSLRSHLFRIDINKPLKLFFPVVIGNNLRNGAALCQRKNGLKFNVVEKILFRYCFS